MSVQSTGPARRRDGEPAGDGTSPGLSLPVCQVGIESGASWAHVTPWASSLPRGPPGGDRCRHRLALHAAPTVVLQPLSVTTPKGPQKRAHWAGRGPLTPRPSARWGRVLRGRTGAGCPRGEQPRALPAQVPPVSLAAAPLPPQPLGPCPLTICTGSSSGPALRAAQVQTGTEGHSLVSLCDDRTADWPRGAERSGCAGPSR